MPGFLHVAREVFNYLRQHDSEKTSFRFVDLGYLGGAKHVFTVGGCSVHIGYNRTCYYVAKCENHQK